MGIVFYHCPVCGNVIIKAVDGGPVPHCCGSEMEELVPHREEKMKEKHLPVVEKCHDHSYIVKVGAEPHPMTPEHWINFICVETMDGFCLHWLFPDEEPKSEFKCEDKPVAIYEYCSVHGLWMTDCSKNCKL